MGLLHALIFSFAFTMGATDGAFYQYKPLDYEPLGSPLFSDFSAEVQLGPVFVGGEIRDDFFIKSLTSYDPFQNIYTVDAGLRFTLERGIVLEGGYAHSCYHPEEAYGIAKLLQGQIIALPRFEGATDSFYISIKGKLRP
jgi:hypothetical protein